MGLASEPEPCSLIRYAKIRSPSFLILRAAFQSRSITKPHAHWKTRSERDNVSLTSPQQEQVLDEGNHLSILMSFFPWFSNLYSRNSVNNPQAVSMILLPKCSDLDIPFMSKSSMTMPS